MTDTNNPLIDELVELSDEIDRIKSTHCSNWVVVKCDHPIIQDLINDKE